MIYVSQLTLGRKDIKSLRVTDDYSVHRVIYSLFPDRRTDEEKKTSVSSGFLYADLGGNFWGRRFLILSDKEPSEIDLDDGKIETKLLPERFFNFKQYRFTVVVNPTIRKAQSGKAVPIKDKNEIRQWFSDRAEQLWGFTTDETLTVDKVEVKQIRGKGGHKFAISQVHLSGILTVAEKDQFIKAVSHGIGRTHAFGCGLLQIVPFIHE